MRGDEEEQQEDEEEPLDWDDEQQGWHVERDEDELEK